MGGFGGDSCYRMHRKRTVRCMRILQRPYLQGVTVSSSTVGDVVQLVRTLPRHWLESYTVTDKVAGRKPVPRTFYLAAAPRRARVRDTSLRNLRS